MATVEQIELDEDPPRLWVQNLEIRDEDIVEFLSTYDAEEREEAIKRALQVGAQTLLLSETTKDVEFVRHEFSEMQRVFEEQIETVREELEGKFGDSGVVAKILDDHFGDEGKMREHIEDAFGEDGEFQERLDDELGEGGERIQEALSLEKDTPLSRLESQLRREIREVQDKIERKQEREGLKQETTLKGDDFEADLERLLDEFVYQTSHQLEYTGETVGEVTDSKKGDFVLNLQTGQRIVIEAKSEKDISQNDIKQEVRDAIENRAADYGIFVAECEEYIPDKVGYLQEFDQEILSIALSADEDDELDPRLLQIGLNWCQMRAVQAAVDTGEAIDSENIQIQVQEIESAIDKFSQIKGKCTKIRDRADEIDDLLDEYDEEITEKLTNIRIELTSA